MKGSNLHKQANRNNFESGKFIFGGRSVSYERFGSGHAVIFLHGWGGNRSAFLFAAKALSRHFLCVTLDFSGFGDSEEPPFAYSVADYADEVLALMAALGIQSATLVGHSFGGRVAIELASKRPHAVDGLALVDSAGLKPRRGPSYHIKVFAHKMLKKMGRKGLKGSADFEAASGVMRQCLVKAVNYDQTPLLDRIDCDTLLVWGNGDRDTPMYMARKFERHIKRSRLVVLDGGHFAFAEQPDAFLDALSDFLSREGRWKL